MEIDKAVIDSINAHVQLHIPEIPKFELVPTDQLPESYELEDLSPEDTIGTLKKSKPFSQKMYTLHLKHHLSISDSSFRMSSKKDTSSPPLSTPSQSTTMCSSPEPSLNGSFSRELPSMQKGKTVRVHVTLVIDPTEFYVVNVENLKALMELEADMAQNASSLLKEPEEVIKGEFALILFDKFYA